MSKSKFSEQTAVSLLIQDGCEILSGKRIRLPKKSFSGLKVCSAYDYLLNYHKYK